MSVPIEKVRSLSDPLKVFQFRVSISPLPKIVSGINGDELSLRCTSSQLPTRTIEETTVSLGGYDTHYAGRTTYDAWSATFVEGINAEMIKFFELWQSLCNDPVLGVQQQAFLYKTNAIVELYSGENNITHRRRMIGLFPTVVAPIGLDMSSSEAAKLDVSFRYDYFTDLV
jgi:hypothetical protein